MSSRGRGYGTRGYGGSRGGYRGSYRGSGPRGTYGGGRGRGGYYSNDRYGSSGGDRFSGRMDDGGYKKSYRNDGQLQYGSRDYGGRMSPDRKRMRLEGPSGDRRSHDGGYGGGYGARRDYSERRGDHRRSPSREMYRKSPTRTPSGRPLRSGPPRRARGMRGSRGIRGRAFRSRILPSLTSRPLRYRPKIVKLRSAVRTKHDSGSSTAGEEDWDTQEAKKIMKEEGIEPTEESPKNESETPGAIEEAEEDAVSDKEVADEASGEEQDTEVHTTFDGRPMIPLACSHCKEKCLTFRMYARHLLAHRHKVSMSAVALRHNQKLAMLRARQRAEQRRLEDEAPDGELQTRTLFCGVCKLNHRQSSVAHHKSEAHLQIKRFLMPFCAICRIQLRSPMQYEHHLLSLEHIKRKARNTRQAENGEGSGDEGLNVDLDNFMTLDSVGDVDEVDDSDTEKKIEEGESREKKKKAEINVGSEHIKKVEVQYCDLCKIFITRGAINSSEDEMALRRHCRQRIHLTRYVKHRDTRSLRQHAERIHRIHQMQAAADKDSGIKKEKTEEKVDVNDAADNSVDKGKEVKTESANSTGVTLEETEGEEKLWADVDKDLGDLLREVDQTGNKSSDDEDESNTGRYDRFRKSEKKTDNTEDLNGEADTNAIEVKQDKAAAQPAAVAADAKQAA